VLPVDEESASVLAYHLVGAGTTSPVDLPEEVFRRQMEELQALARPVHLADLVERIERPSRSESRLVAVTFDDAFRNFFERVWPVVVEYGIPVTLFVPVGFLEGAAPSPLRGATDLAPLSWDELREMIRSGLVSVGSHGFLHRDFRRLGADEIGEDLARARETLRRRLGVEARAFCYPRGLWSPRVEQEVARWHDIAVVGGGRRPRAETFAPLRVSRVPLRRDSPLSLRPILEAPIWIEELVADYARRRRVLLSAFLR